MQSKASSDHRCPAKRYEVSHSFYCKVHSSKTLMGIWATNLLHRFSDAMQLCRALEVGTFFLKILLRIAIMAILSSIPPLSNSQTSNKHFRTY